MSHVPRLAAPAATFTVACLTLTLGAGSAAAEATIVVYDDQAAFLDATCAVAQGDYLPQGVTMGDASAGELTLSYVAPAFEFIVDDWTPLLPGDELALSGIENMDIAAPTPMTSLGFWMVEAVTPGGTTPCNFPVCLDSTFEATLFLGGTSIASATFDAPDAVAAFVGLHCNHPFDRVELRELTDDIGNEYFGEMFVGRCAASVNYGEPTAGTGGFVPQLLAPASAPKTGGPSSISARDLLGGAPVLLAFGVEPQDQLVKGIHLLVLPTAYLPILPSGQPGVAGDGGFDLPLTIPDSPLYVDLTLYLQVIVLDDGGPAFGYAASPGLEFTICEG